MMDALSAARSEVELSRKVFGEDRNGWTRASRALAALVAEIDAAPVGLVVAACASDSVGVLETTIESGQSFKNGTSVRLLSLASGGAGEVGR